MALDDLDDRFAAAVKVALGGTRGARHDESDIAEGSECPSADAIAAYYEHGLGRVERAALETHFSRCARCQGTLAALLRAAPVLDAAVEAGGLSGATTRGAAADSAGLRERWREIRPAWRIAGVSIAATAMIAGVVVAGMQVYHGIFGRQNEELAALSSSPQQHHVNQAPAAASPPDNADLALHDKPLVTELDKKSVGSAGLSEPKPAIAPPAAVPPAATGAASPESRDGGAIGAPGSTNGTAARSPATENSKSVRSNTLGNATGNPVANPPAETAAPAEETPPPVAPTNNDQNGAGPATADQAAAALGALAATPAPATSPTSPATSNNVPAAGSKDTAAAPTGVHQKRNTQKQDEIAVLAPPPARLEQFQKGTVTQLQAQTSQSATRENPATSGSAGERPDTGSASALMATQQAQEQQAQMAKERIAQQRLAQDQLAQQQLAKAKLAEEKRQADIAKAEVARQAEVARKAKATRQAEATQQAAAARQAELVRKAEVAQKAEVARKAELARKVDLARRAELARKTEQAKRDAELKRRTDQARREAQAKAATASSAATASPPQSTARLGAQTSSTQPRPEFEAGNTIAGGDIAMAERPSAPAVAAIAPGIPVAPHAVLVSSPDHSVYWSLLSSGLIYRSNDRKSWTPQSTGVQAELLAGTAPSGTVCWAVGRNGVILLTEDGVHWERVKSPTASDLIGITAASKDVATIFTASGANYSTFDGGSNWEQAH